MSPRPAPQPTGFASLAAAMTGQPLHELCPAGPGAEAAALGFGLGLAASWAGRAGVIWAGEDSVFAEDGGPYPPGLAQLGLDPERLILVRAAKREEALWAAEQGLAAPGAVVICALGARGRPLDLKATRRLLLIAERNKSRCLLVRPQAEASAAWTRWRVTHAPSNADPAAPERSSSFAEARARELGAPAYAIELVRNRAGPAGARFTIEWNAYARCFAERLQEKCEVVFRQEARQA